MKNSEGKRYINKRKNMDESEWIVALFVIVALVCGWIIKYNIENEMAVFSNNDISLAYPQNWIVETNIYSNEQDSGFKGRAEYVSDRILLRASSVLSESLYKTSISLRAIMKPEQLQTENLFDPLPGIVLDLAEEYKNGYCNFDIINNQKIIINDIQGIRVDYTFVSSSMLDPKGYSIPSVVYGIDYIVPVNNTVYVISVRFDADKTDEELDFAARVMHKLRIKT
jgi:hypothetical protein